MNKKNQNTKSSKSKVPYYSYMELFEAVKVLSTDAPYELRVKAAAFHLHEVRRQADLPKALESTYEHTMFQVEEFSDCTNATDFPHRCERVVEMTIILLEGVCKYFEPVR